MIDSFIEYTTLNEIFNDSLPLNRNKTEEEKLKDKYYPHTLTNIEVYNTEHEGIPYHFVRFKHKNAWEVHFKPQNDYYDRTKTNKGSGASKLVSTGISLYREKLDRNQPIRYYGDDDQLHDLYNKAFKYISKKHYDGKLFYRDDPKFESPGGKILSAVEVHKNDPESSTIKEMFGLKSSFRNVNELR